MNQRFDRKLRAAVARGAALLDKHQPGWVARVACDRLAMTSCADCLLGQLYGGYETGFRQLIQHEPSIMLFSAADHGFTLPEDFQDAFGEVLVLPWFDRLADHWREEVHQRLQAQEQSS